MTHLLAAFIGYLIGRARSRKEVRQALALQKALRKMAQEANQHARQLELRHIRDQVFMVHLITKLRPDNFEAWISKVEAYFQFGDDSGDENGPTVH